MNQAVSLAVLAVGIALLVFGINSSESLNSEVSRFFTGSPTDKAMWLMIGGIAVTILGLVGLMRGSK